MLPTGLMMDGECGPLQETISDTNGNVKPKTGNDVICFVYFRCGTAYVIEEVKSVKM